MNDCKLCCQNFTCAECHKVKVDKLTTLVENTWKDAWLSKDMRHSLGGDLSWTQSKEYARLQLILEDD